MQRGHDLQTRRPRLLSAGGRDADRGRRLRARLMKILHLIPTMTGGGAERQCIRLVRELTNAGHDVCLIMLRGGEYFQELLDTGVEVINLNSPSNYGPRTLLRIWREIRRRRPDVVQSWLPMMDVLAGILRLGMRFSWVMTERGRPLASRSLKEKLRRRLARRADALIANSPLAREAWQDALHSDRCHCILNIVDVQAILADQEVPPPPIPQVSRLVAYVGRLYDEQKNVVQLLRAFIRVVRTFPDVGVIIMGDGPDRGRLESMVREEGLSDRIVLLGFVERPWRYLNMVDVVALVSHYEGQPNVLLESLPR